MRYRLFDVADPARSVYEPHSAAWPGNVATDRRCDTLSSMIRTTLLFVLALGATGCVAGGDGPELLVISASMYARAFDAADEVVRGESMPPTLRDRRSGVIETEPRIAGSVLEPWRVDNATSEQAWENTYAFQRRRVRVEFLPEGFDPDTSDELVAPDVVGLDSPFRDLTTHEGRIEVRVWVYLERSYTYGVRRSTWTASGQKQARIIDAGIDVSSTPPPTDWERQHAIAEERRGAIRSAYWVPVSRDAAFERRVLAAIQQRLTGAG